MNDEKEQLEKRKIKFETWFIDNHDHIQHLHQLRQMVYSNYDTVDKNLLYISSGAYAVSIAFIGQFDGFDLPTFNKIILVLSWCFFGLTIVSTLFGFRASNKSLVRRQNEVVKLMRDSANVYFSNATPKENTNINNMGGDTCVAFWNNSAIFSFLLAIVLLSFFAMKTYLCI